MMGQSHPGFWSAFLLVVLLVSSASATNTSYNQSTKLDAGTTTPWDLWVMSGLIGFGLVLITLMRSQSSTIDTEINAIISVISWIPIAYCAYASFNIDRVVGYGANDFGLMVVHTIYQYPTIGILMFVFLAVAILNTVRIIALHSVLKGKSDNK